MEVNYELRDQIFQIIKNQIKANNPPETKQTFDRLRKMGYDKFVTKQLIGQCIALELWDVMKNQNPFDEERYIKNLKNLPEDPFE